MKCPKCGSEVRPSKKYPGYYLCDTCRKRYSEDSVIDDTFDYEDNIPESKERPARSSAKAPRPSSRPSSVKAEPSGRKTKKRRKKGGLLKVILLLILLAAAAAAVIFAVKYLKGKEDSPNKNPNTTAEDDASKDNAAPKTYSVEEVAEINNIKVQVLGYDTSSGDDWATPGEGNEFVFVNIEIVNGSEEDITVSSMASFENYCDDTKLDYSPNAFTALATTSDKKQMDGSIAAGKTLNGYLCLEVPSTWNTIEIHYADNVWSDEKVIFELNKQ